MTRIQGSKYSGIIVAAGRGKRFGGYKQLVKINGRPIVHEVIDRFARCGIDELILVVRRDILPYFTYLKDLYSMPIKIIEGGDERGDSVYNGVKSSSYDKVLIHDAARPNITCNLINRVKNALLKYDAVVPIVPIRDTVVKVEGEEISGKVLRDKLKLVQTPQGFKKDLLLKGFDIARGKKLQFSDESTMLWDTLGISSHVVEGENLNIKITYREDLLMFRHELTTMGYDIHRLKEGGVLKIGGVVVKRGIQAVAHSDGDVVLHALIDALLSIKGEEDIGTLFPDTDVAWKNADSKVLLSKALDFIGKVDILKVDLTCILEHIKLSPFKEEIRKNIARYLNIPKERVSFKAKTKEGVGEVGKGKAVEAFCIITYSDPV